ncbi:MAG: M50 family metallopeptidase, partial [Patescibacteria group bacterium]
TFTARDEAGKEVVTQKPGLGVALTDSGIVSYPFFQSIIVALSATGVMIYTIVTFLLHAFQTLVFSSFSGPVGIAAYTGVALQEGFSHVLLLMIQLSLSLAILNILPFPALDGGRALFAIIEKFRGKPLPRNAENIAHLIGFAALMLVALLATIKDVRALF